MVTQNMLHQCKGKQALKKTFPILLSKKMPLTDQITDITVYLRTFCSELPSNESTMVVLNNAYSLLHQPVESDRNLPEHSGQRAQ